MVAKSKDADRIPLTPEAKTASNRRKKSTGKADTLLPKKCMASAKGKGRPRVRTSTSTNTSTAPKLSKAKGANAEADKKPKILKKRRQVRKRMSLNKLVELTRVIHDIGRSTCTALNLSWTNVKRERSNTAIRRKRTDFSSGFAIAVQDESVENVLEESDEQYNKIFEDHVERVVGSEMDHSSEHNTCSQLEEDIIGKDKDFDIDANTEKMDFDGANRLDQKDCAATVNNSDDLSMSEGNGCDGVNNCVILETQQMVAVEPPSGKIDESSDISRVEEDLVCDETNVTAAELEENAVAWVPLTPQIQAEVGHSEKDSGIPEIGHSWSANNHDGFVSNNTMSDSAKTASNCGQSESLIDILKKMSTRGVDLEKKPHKRMKMKRHRPKVVDPTKPITPSTPKPRTPKPARKLKKRVDPSKSDDGKATRKSSKRACRRKLDFDEECCTMGQEELKTQDTTDNSLKVEPNPPKICKKRRMMRRRVSVAKLNNLITRIREKLPSECDSTYSATPAQVQEESVQEVLVGKSVIKDNKVSCNGSIQHCCEKCGNCQDGTKIDPGQKENVLLIQDEAVRDALEDFAVKKMQSLCIEDDTSNQLVVQDSNRFGEVVVSGEQTDASKNQKPAVDLDRETMIVWDLLMGDKWSEAAEAEALGDEEYMKKERELFREKLDVFLNRMHLVQGDRQFTPWKGSIVDSIVGVFLTQNVSDHLSSSAFMALVAKYPPLSVDEQNSQFCLWDQQVMAVEPSSGTSEVETPMCVSQESNSISKVEPPMKNGNESISQVDATQGRTKGRGKAKQEKPINWDELRKQYSHGMSRERTEQNADSVNWEAVRQASAAELAKVIVDRGMSNQLAGRIKGFLDRLLRDHGSIDLEWLKKVPPPKAKDYLLSVSGLGLKSTECVRLLALHVPAFPVDTNAGRFFVRVGWVPLKPLSENVPLHLLNQYPSLDSIQKYIWPRICDNDHSLLYESHCHSVTAAKTFCTKTRPNCNECPMRGECKHYASALASARPRLEGSQPKSGQEAPTLTNYDGDEPKHHYNSEPIIEFPASPVAETVPMEPLDDCDIEDIGRDSEISAITLSGVDFSEKLPSFMGQDDEISKALVAINPHIGSIPMPKQKLDFRLRTVHQVYELPDSHPLLATFPNQEHGDRSPYLLAIWREDERSEEATECDTGSPCLLREVAQYQKPERIKGTILIPCFTANGGRFPLNGTYFQINEVFADHESSRQPIDVPIELIWNLRRRILYCGTSITSICRDMSMVEISFVFNRSFICIRGFDRKSGAAKSLAKRFHLCKSRAPGK